MDIIIIKNQIWAKYDSFCIVYNKLCDYFLFPTLPWVIILADYPWMKGSNICFSISALSEVIRQKITLILNQAIKVLAVELHCIHSRLTVDELCLKQIFGRTKKLWKQSPVACVPTTSLKSQNSLII